MTTVVKKKIIAHRGASKDYRENTLEAFQYALNVGSDAIEFDLQQTKDSQLIVYHDAFLPILGSPQIANLTLNEIQQISKDLQLQIPLFAEVLYYFNEKIFLDIELKQANPELVLQQVNYLKRENFQLKSFNANIVKKIKVLNQTISTALIIDYSWLISLKLFQQILIAQPNQLHFHWKEYQRKLFNPARFLALPIWVWTVDKVEDLSKFLKDSRVEGIITNEPIKAKKLQQLLSF